MGFFDIFDLPAPRSRPLSTFFPFTINNLFAAPKAVEHDISFEITIPRSLPKASAFRESCPPKPVAMPLEVVLSIMEAAYFHDDLEVDDRTLRSCALVCTAWSMQAQKLLFTQVTLRTQRAFESFSTAVDRSTERGCALGNAVVRMRVVLDHNQPFTIQQQSFALAVTMCPNLYELNLALYGCVAPGEDIIGVPDVSRMRRPAPSFEEQTLSLLKSGPRITALQFSNWSENDLSLVQLLSVWPTLKSLIMTGTPPQLPPVSSEPFGCALDELRMNFQTSPSVDVMKWLLHNSTDSLRILEIGKEPSAHLLDYLASAHGSTLHSLWLPACASPDHTLAIQKCTKLREVVIESSSAPSSLYKSLPNSMEHVALGLDADTALQPVIDVVKKRDSLKAVTIHAWNGGSSNLLLSALKIACAYRGVDLRMTSDVQVFRKLVRGDPVALEAYPRPKSLENIHAMR